MECKNCGTEMNLLGFESEKPKRPKYICTECGKQEVNTARAWVAWLVPSIMIRLDSTSPVNETVLNLAVEFLGPIHIQGGNYKEMMRLESVVKFPRKFSSLSLDRKYFK